MEDKPQKKSLFDLGHEHEKRLVVEALRRSKGSVHLAAAALDISRVTLWRKMKKYEIVPTEFEVKVT